MEVLLVQREAISGVVGVETQPGVHLHAETDFNAILVALPALPKEST